MNKIYSKIWNKSLGCLVVASELASSQSDGMTASPAHRPPRTGVLICSITLALVAMFGISPSAHASYYTIGGGSACSATGTTSVGPDGVVSQTQNPLVDGSGNWSNLAGCSANGNGQFGVTLFGSFTTVTGDGGSAFGLGSRAGLWSTALGMQAQATGQSSFAGGYNAKASALDTVAIGSGGGTSAANATIASATGAVAIGGNATKGAQASATNAIAIGGESAAVGIASIAIGKKASAAALGSTNIAIGNDTVATGTAAALGDSLAIGAAAKATGQDSTAIGGQTTASATNTLAIGNNGTSATKVGATAFGAGAQATGAQSLATGNAASASADNSAAIGSGAKATHANSVALGVNSVTAAPHTGAFVIAGSTTTAAGAAPMGVVSVGTGVAGGERQIQNVGAGQLASASTDAVNGSQLYATNSAVSALADTLDATTTHYYSVNSTGGTNELNDGATGADALAMGKGATATSINGIAIGLNAASTADGPVGQSSIAIGANAKGAAQSSIALGDGAQALRSSKVGSTGGASAVAVGANSIAQGDGTDDGVNASSSTAVGGFSTATADGAVAYGEGSAATAYYSNALGAYSVASGDGSVAVGGGSLAAADGAIAIGGATSSGATTLSGFASATAESAIAIGTGTKAAGLQSVAVGLDANAQGTSGVAMGAGVISGATGQNVAIGSGGTTANSAAAVEGAVAIGRGQQANGDGAVAIGNRNTATGNGSVAIGRASDATGAGSLAMGNSTDATGNRSVAFGSTARATDDSAIAIGNSTEAGGGIGAIAVGRVAKATGAGALAMGSSANAAATNAVAIGPSAVAANANSVALGAGSLTAAAHTTGAFVIAGSTATAAGLPTTAAGVVSVGQVGTERQIQNVAAGLLDATSTDAVNGSQLFATNTAVGDLDDRVTVNEGDITTLQGDVADNTTDIAALQDDALLWDPAANGGAGAYSANHGGTGPNKITNVADGTLAAGSTDAVNGSQLNATNQSILDLGDVVDANKTHYYSVNDNGTHGANFDNDGAQGTGSIAAGIGASTSLAAANSIALGSNAVSAGASAVAVGVNARADFVSDIAFGTNAHATSDASGLAPAIAFGSEATASKSGDTAFGILADASGGQSIAVGYGATSSGVSSAAFGTQASSTAQNSVALGGFTYADGDFSTAIGGATATAEKSIAIGDDASADAAALYGVALGNNAIASTARSVALGDASTTATAVGTATGIIGGTTYTYAGAAPVGTVSVGSATEQRTVTNVAAGRVTAASTDTINGSQLYATHQKVGANTTNIASNTTAITSLDGRVTTNEGDITTLQGDVAGNTTDIAALQDDALLWDPTANGGAGAYSANHGGTGPNKITNVADGTAATDAVNVAQLNAAQEAATTHYYSVNSSGQGAGSNYDNDGAVGDEALAAGSGAFAGQLRDVAVGADAYAGAVAGATVEQGDNIAVGSSQATGGGSVAIGQGSVATGSNFAGNNNALAVGSQATVLDYNGVALGTSASTGVGAVYATAIGSQATVDDDAAMATAIGASAVAHDERAVAIGSYAEATGYGSMALGESASTTGETAIAIGGGAQALQDGAVALGAGSVTAAAAATPSGTIDGTTYTYAGGAPISTVSVGKVGSERTITNVAAGRVSDTSTDAINGSQLYATNSAINDVADTANTGWNITTAATGSGVANGSSVANVGPGDTATITAGDNMVVTQAGAEVALGVNPVMTGLTSIALTSGPSISSTGIAMDGTKITDLAAGTDPTDAVNKSQLDDLADNAVQYDDATKGSVTLAGTTSTDGGLTNGTVIGNVAQGDVSNGSTEAVNGTQLWETNQDVAQNATDITNLDGRVTVNEGNITQLGDTITTLAGDTSTTYTDANGVGIRYARTNEAGLAAIDSYAQGQGSTAVGYNAVASAANAVALGRDTTASHADSVALGSNSATTVGAQAAYTGYAVGASSSTGEVNVGGRKLTGVAAGEVDSDGVNVSQLKAVDSKLDDLSDNAVQYDDATKGSVTLAGTTSTDGGLTNGTVIGNVAQGDVSNGSTEAVNGTQLWETNQDVAQNATDITNLDGRVTVNEGNITQLGDTITTLAGDTSTTYTDANGVGIRYARTNEAGLAAIDSYAQGQGSTAVGYNAVASAANAVALGRDTTASHADSVALGSNSATTVGAQAAYTGYAVGASSSTGEVNVGGRKLTGLAAGEIDSDGVNVSQLKAVDSKLDDLSDNAVQYDDATKGSVTLAGTTSTDGGLTNGTVIGNVAQGDVSNGSTEAVNGTQLWETNQDVAQNATDITNLDGRVTVNEGNIATLGDTLTEVAGDTSATYVTNNGRGVKYVRTNDTGLVEDDAHAQALGSTAVGYNAIAAAENAVAIGRNTVANGANSTALGQGAVTNGDFGTAIGGGDATDPAKVNSAGRFGSAVGFGSQANGVGDTAMGTYADTGAANVDPNDDSSQSYRTAVGYAASATGDASAALGAFNDASGDRSVALGYNATSSHDDSVALGANSATTVGAQAAYTGYAVGASSSTGEVNVGGRKLTGVAAGEIDSDGVNVSQLKAVDSKLDDLADNAVLYDDATKGSVTLGGTTSTDGGLTNGTVIGNVAQGDVSNGSTEAVNGTQLWETNQDVAQNATDITNLDGRVTVNEGAITQIGDTITELAGDTSTTYTDANGVGIRYARTNEAGLAAIDSYAQGQGSTALGYNAVASAGNAVAIGRDAVAGHVDSVALGANSVTMVGAQVAYTGYAVGASSSTGEVNVGGRKLTGLAAGEVDSDGVNVSQLKAVDSKLDDLADNAVQYDDSTKGTVTLGGASSTDGGLTNGTKITNVAQGDVSDGSTDAVNGTQLNETNENVAQNATNIANNTTAITALDGRVTTIEGDITNIGNGSVGMFQVSQDHNTPPPAPTGADSAAGGANAVASGDGSLAVGNSSTASGDNGTALGNAAVASGAGSTAVGQGAEATADGSVALGNGASDGGRGAESYTGKYSGAQNDTTGTVSVGNAATGESRTISNVADAKEATDAVNLRQLDGAVQAANDYTDTQISKVSGDLTDIAGTVNNIQKGADGMFQVSQDANAAKPEATGTNAVAGGNNAVASGNNGTAVGNDTVASGEGSTALGNGAQATAANSVAIGAGSTADRANSVSVGSAGAERQITNVAAGTAKTDAANVGQLEAIQAASVQYDRNPDGSIDYTSITVNQGGAATTIHNVSAGTAATDAVNVGQLDGAINKAIDWSTSYTDQRFDTLNKNVNAIGNRANGGIASAMAMASLPQAYAPNQSAAAVALGNFHGETGIAVGVSTITESGRYVFKLNATSNTRGDTGVGVGAAVVW